MSQNSLAAQAYYYVIIFRSVCFVNHTERIKMLLKHMGVIKTMSNLAYFFAGQGAAVSGMGRDLYENHAAARRVFELGSDTLGLDLMKLCFTASTEELSLTKNTQPAIFTMSLASCAVLAEHGMQPDAVAGFSLGEISALTQAGAVSLEDGFQIIRARGDCMQKAAEQSGGAMVAVLGLSAEKIAQIADETPGYVLPVNYNSPVQTVIAGEKAAVAEAAQRCLDAGAKRAVRLAVNAAFHSAMMQDAAEEFSARIAGISFSVPNIPVYSNTTGRPIDDFSDLPAYLARQMTSPVRWVDTVQNLASAGITQAIEHGPGKVLSGLARRIAPEISCLSCDNNQNLTAILEKI